MRIQELLEKRQRAFPDKPELFSPVPTAEQIVKLGGVAHVRPETLDNGMDVSYSMNDSYGEFCPDV